MTCAIRYTGDAKLDKALAEVDPKFEAFVAKMPASYWARYDLSAVRVGWHYGRQEQALQHFKPDAEKVK